MNRLRALAVSSVFVATGVVLAFGCGDTVDDPPSDAADATPDVRDAATAKPDAPTLAGEAGGGGDASDAIDASDASDSADSSDAIDASDGGDVRDAGDAGARDRPTLGACTAEAECAPNGHCIEIVAGGYRTCLFPLPERQACTDGGIGGPFGFDDECCGACDGGGVCSLRMSCGGAFMNPHNVCVYDGCSSDAECGANGVCMPSTDGGVRRCLVSNECRVHADCKAAPDGICAITGQIGPSTDCRPYTCGTDARSFGPMRCHYGLECASDQDCDAGHCEVDSASGRPLCRPKTRPNCPPPP